MERSIKTTKTCDYHFNSIGMIIMINMLGILIIVTIIINISIITIITINEFIACFWRIKLMLRSATNWISGWFAKTQAISLVLKEVAAANVILLT
jgi:hypothetical protein